MARRSDDRPRHEQVAADIRARIMSGELPSGSQLPSTAQLINQYSVANATVQRALAALKEEGYLHSRVGKGVYVRDRQPLVMAVEAYVPPARGGYTYQLLDVAEVQPPADVALALGVADKEPAILRHRLLSYDGEPVELSWSYYPVSIARGTAISSRQKLVGGVPRALADLGHPQRDLVDRLSVRMPTTQELEILALPPQVPVIRQFRVIRSVHGHPVEVSVLIKGGHLHELRYHQEIQPESG
ncbi:GntR family transcriptional regulator [Micromonospora sp. NPDC047557]|uniref:GntR family transcriptional regulator n=1 Tax=Micromonospora sp. NPDC047557 TaxID=3364250 RepID=UPI0037140BD3